tara:strand:+ start:604 stop:1650 length:1047 start_codon:yes stop_codon:yes gene_type:complete
MNYLKTMLIMFTLVLFGCVDDATDAEKYTKPTVNAGADQLHTLPKNSLTLKGSAKTYPKHLYKIKTTRWKQVSGPQQLAILNSDSLTATLINPTVAGTYEFELYAKDSIGRTNTDRIKIILREQEALATARSTPDYLDDYELMWNFVAQGAAVQHQIEQKWYQIYQPYLLKALEIRSDDEWQQLLVELNDELSSSLQKENPLKVGADYQSFELDWSLENGVVTLTISEPNLISPAQLVEKLNHVLQQLDSATEIELDLIHKEPVRQQTLLALMASFTPRAIDVCLPNFASSIDCHQIHGNIQLEGKRVTLMNTEPESELTNYLIALESGEDVFVLEPSLEQVTQMFSH